MIDWTEQEEQEVIARAKAGDPKANYELSLWALERSEEEPDEIRWNRLAAKCLVKAAQAGYGPAQERMAGLLEKTAPAPAAQSAPAPRRAAPREEPPEPVRLSDARQAASRRGARQTAGTRASAPRQTTTARHPAPRAVDEDDYDEDEGEEEEYEDEDWDDEEDRPRRRPARRPARSKSSKPARSDGRRAGPFSGWGEEQWRRMELICIGVCAVLIIAIVVMFITGRKTGAAPAGGSAVPAAGQVTEATPEPELEPYPDDTVKAAIQASDIEVQPADLDYVKAATTASVTVGEGSSTLRLRTGPNTNYRQLAEMPNGTSVDVFAKKDDWVLVLYQADAGPLYGWCSSAYLITTSGSVG